MNTKFGIKNFRTFDKDGVIIDIAPIAILTGCNSSGKSSITKGITLLNSFFINIQNALNNKDDIELNKYKLDFTTEYNRSLGDFTKVLNRSSKDGIITFSYSMYSHILETEIIVNMDFKANEKDILNSGRLQSYSIVRSDSGKIIIASEYEGTDKVDLEAIYDNFKKFLRLSSAISIYNDSSKLLNQEDPFSIEEVSKAKRLYKLSASEIESFQEDNSLSEETDFIRNNNIPLLIDKDNYELYLKKRSNWNSLYYLPVLERLNKYNKKNIVNFFTEEQRSIKLTQEIINDFIRSKYETFINYYKSKVKNFLSFRQVIPFYAGKYHNKYGYISLNDSSTSSKAAKPLGVFSVLNSPQSIYCSKNGCGDNISDQEIGLNRIIELLVIVSTPEEREGFYNGDIEYPLINANLYIEESFFKYVYLFNAEALSPKFLENITYISSSCINVQRTYLLNSTDEFSSIIKDYSEAKRNFKFGMCQYEPDSFINKWAKRFGFGEKLSVNLDSEGFGIVLSINKMDGNITSLADEGFGDSQLACMLIQLETTIMNSQVPTAYQINPRTKRISKSHTIVIEEPEIHLHPRYQSILAEMFLDAFNNYHIQFLIETHSEYLIRKFQTLVADKSLDKGEISICYVSDDEHIKENEPKIKNIKINEDGRLTDRFGSGFFDEAVTLTINLIK